MTVVDYYLLLGLLVHFGFLGLVDWLGYHHLVTHGYHPSLLFLLCLNIAIFIAVYYLIVRTLYQRIMRRKTARQRIRQRRHLQELEP